jgi:hypothetical protein
MPGPLTPGGPRASPDIVACAVRVQSVSGKPQGSGPFLVLLHGGLDDSSVRATEAEALNLNLAPTRIPESRL